MTEENAAIPKITTSVQNIRARRRIPCATYRLQLNNTFTFKDARALIPYFNDLGISDLYVSPIMLACPGSTHGYDICDHNKINPELGGESEFEVFSAELLKHDMGLVVDIVPNHMSISDTNNSWWMDVLENGPSSLYAAYFDIDWDPVKAELKDKVLLPILEDQYGNVLENGKLRLVLESGSFYITYYDIKLPVAPRSYSRILSYKLDSLSESLGSDNPDLQEFQSILTALSHLPARTEQIPEKIVERNREKEVIKRRLDTLYQASAEIHSAVDCAVRIFNGTVGDSGSFDNLDSLIYEQVYRPAFWKVAAEEINYRRFFDINHLAAIRMEEPEVFKAAHSLLLELMACGKITGLRIDHADGLWNPAAYLKQLQYTYVRQSLQPPLPADIPENEVDRMLHGIFEHSSDLPDSPGADWPVYAVAEKILSPGEILPQEWAVYGTTGYDFLNIANGLFVDTSQRGAFEKIYTKFTGKQIRYDTLVNSSKKMIMLVSLASEIHALSHELDRISERNRRYRDFTLNTVSFAIREVIASLEIYRTYITGPDNVSQRDRTYIERAVADVKKRNPRTASSLFDFIRDTLLLRNLQDFPESEREQLIHWVMKFQQITGPVMAKGVEDTVFYVFNRLVSLNEVGGDPQQFGTSETAFHHHNMEVSLCWPHSMLASSTHDTKRSEDIRARINVLSEMPGEWAERLRKWRKLNASAKVSVDGEPAPDPNDEYLLYQTLLGTWPADASDENSDLSAEAIQNFRERIVAYMNKAIKEAKIHTSWINPNIAYDEAVQSFVNRVLNRERKDAFWKDFLAFQKRIEYFGRFNAIAQLLLKLTCPGVPDIYQGSELWNLRLVDPDNREPVDYESRVSLLQEFNTRLQIDRSTEESRLKNIATEMLELCHDGRIKLYVMMRTLRYRRGRPELFSNGTYNPLETKGVKADHCCAFSRTRGSHEIVVAVPRLIVGLTNKIEEAPLGEEIWQNTQLVLPDDRSGAQYRNIFTDEILTVEKIGDPAGFSLSAVFGCFPVALLERIVNSR